MRGERKGRREEEKGEGMAEGRGGRRREGKEEEEMKEGRVKGKRERGEREDDGGGRGRMEDGEKEGGVVLDTLYAGRNVTVSVCATSMKVMGEECRFSSVSSSLSSPLPS